LLAKEGAANGMAVFASVFAAKKRQALINFNENLSLLSQRMREN